MTFRKAAVTHVATQSYKGKAYDFLDPVSDFLMPFGTLFAVDNLIYEGIHDIEPKGWEHADIGSFVEIEWKFWHFVSQFKG